MRELTDLNSGLREYVWHCAAAGGDTRTVSTARASSSGGAWGSFCASVTERLVNIREGQRIWGGLLESFLEEASF